MSAVTLEAISATEIMLILIVLSGIGYKIFDKLLASNCYELSCCGIKCKRQPLTNEQSLEILNNQPHVNHEQLHDIVIHEISKDLEKCED